MTHYWYPGKEKPKDFKYVRVMPKPKVNRSKNSSCPICFNGQRMDAKTHVLRECVACNGTGKIV